MQSAPPHCAPGDWPRNSKKQKEVTSETKLCSVPALGAARRLPSTPAGASTLVLPSDGDHRHAHTEKHCARSFLSVERLSRWCVAPDHPPCATRLTGAHLACDSEAGGPSWTTGAWSNGGRRRTYPAAGGADAVLSAP